MYHVFSLLKEQEEKIDDEFSFYSNTIRKGTK
jgi:hypothetical protein